MFAFLKHSPRKAYDPISFVNACRNKPDGFFMLDSDVFDQNDAGEFLSIFLDKLETSLKYAGIAKKKAQNKDNANNNSRSDGNASDFIKTCFYGDETEAYFGHFCTWVNQCRYIFFSFQRRYVQFLQYMLKHLPF